MDENMDEVVDLIVGMSFWTYQTVEALFDN